MSELATIEPRNAASAPPAQVETANLPGTVAPPPLTKPQKAAIILGVLGEDAAGQIFEGLDEMSLTKFAQAMTKIRKVPPAQVIETIEEFLLEMRELEMSVTGGISTARAMLQDYVNEATLARIIDDVESPSAHNVWQKLGSIDDAAIAEYLENEHPQTISVVMSKLPAEKSARILGSFGESKAQQIIMGLTRTPTLSPDVVDSIGSAVSQDFLENLRQDGSTFKPADRVGSIMNYTPGNIRQAVISFLSENEPELCDQVKRKMFTFQDIPQRVEKRDVAAIVRATDNETLVNALVGAAENAPETREFVLSSISSRIAEQLREELAESGKVKTRIAEDSQSAILKIIRDLEKNGELKLISQDE